MWPGIGFLRSAWRRTASSVATRWTRLVAGRVTGDRRVAMPAIREVAGDVLVAPVRLEPADTANRRGIATMLAWADGPPGATVEAVRDHRGR